MKLIVDGYEVEIKAKRSYETKATKETTVCFLNGLSILAAEAKERYTRIGANGLASWAGCVSDELYGVCEKAGAYKNI